jgi:hypothetical protein
MTDVNVNNFNTSGYTYIKDLFDKNSISILSQYLENKIRRGEWKEELGKDKTSKYFYYADPLAEVILINSKNAVEKSTGRELIPTYSYSRIYQPGEQLFPHVDRPSCEISTTVSIAYKGEPSPIYMQYKNNDPVKFTLEPGDAVSYLGCDVLHWRRPLQEDQLVVQVMLHYVDKNGPYKDYAIDKRSMYGTTSVKE